MPVENYIISSCVISNNTVLKNGKEIFAEKNKDVQAFLLSLYHFIAADYPKFYKMDNLSKLGWLASEILLKDSNIEADELPATGIVLSNKNSSLDADIKYFESSKTFASPALFVYTLPNIVIGEISIRNRFKGENAFFISDEFDASLLKPYITSLFDNNILKLCICGWVDLLKEDYKAVLFLVSTKKRDNLLLFTEENMNRIFNSIK